MASSRFGPSTDDHREFPDPPATIVPSRRVGMALALGTWLLLVLTVPFYFVFLIGSLPEILATMSSTWPAGMRRRAREDDSPESD